MADDNACSTPSPSPSNNDSVQVKKYVDKDELKSLSSPTNIELNIFADTMATTSALAPGLQPHVVAAILAYLNPLDDIPPELLSIPLRQRHHFLAISPYDANPAAYLTWPSPSQGEKDALDELLAALPSADDVDPLQTYPTAYTNDGEATYAHVNVPLHTFMLSSSPGAGLRLIFRWEGSEEQSGSSEEPSQSGWKYHDCKPMPFPSNASSNPPQSSSSPLSPISPVTPSSSTTATTTQKAYSALGDILASQGHAFHSSEDPIPTIVTPPPRPTMYAPASDDDDYWNLYGKDSDEEENRPGRAASDNDEKAEDAYWARYSSVHGAYLLNNMNNYTNFLW